MEEFIQKIEAAKTIAIIGHIRPDGDCVGACLGLYNYICDNFLDKKTIVFLEAIPDKFKFLSGANEILNVPSEEVYDLAVSLDCGARDRHGEFYCIYDRAKDTICLDHHRSNEGFGNYFYCDKDASSCCEILYRHLDCDKISKEVAEAIYLGIIHDTGVLKYPSTSKETMCIAGELIEKGARSQYVIDETFYKVSYKQNKLTGQALLDSELFFDGKLIISAITKKTFEKFECGKEETDGIIDKLRVTDGVEVAALLYELNSGIFKCSLRSVSYVDVSVIAVKYGGGGHIRASGFEITGNLEHVKKCIIDEVKPYI